SARFDTGEVFDTHNAKELMPFPPDPNHVRTQVPMLTDLRKLYDLHQFVINKHAIRGRKILFAPGEELSYIARYAIELPYEEKAARGWMYYDQASDAYRPTVRGAYRITWGLLPPFKTIRISALNREAAAVLQEFEAAGSPSALLTAKGAAEQAAATPVNYQSEERPV